MDGSFPLWLRANHFINLFCMFLLIRSGIQILADHPKLYWNDHSTPGSEWIKFGEESYAQGPSVDING
jgi:methionine sulfoxide reductase catalytic subunit